MDARGVPACGRGRLLAAAGAAAGAAGDHALGRGLAIIVETFDMLGIDSMRIRCAARGAAIRPRRPPHGRGCEGAQRPGVRAVSTWTRRRPSASKRRRSRSSGWCVTRGSSRSHSPSSRSAGPRACTRSASTSRSALPEDGAHLLANADLPGFPREEHKPLRQRRQSPAEAQPPSARRRRRAARQGGISDRAAAGLAVLLHRSRAACALPPIELKARGGRSRHRFRRAGWPDSAADRRRPGAGDGVPARGRVPAAGPVASQAAPRLSGPRATVRRRGR